MANRYDGKEGGEVMDFESLNVGDTVYVCRSSGFHGDIYRVDDAVVTRKLKRQFTTKDAENGEFINWNDRGEKYGVKRSSFYSARSEWVEIDASKAAYLKKMAARNGRISNAIQELHKRIVDKRPLRDPGNAERARFVADLRHVADLFEAVGDTPMEEAQG